MSASEPTLAELGHRLAACADEALLDTALDVLRLDDDARDLVRAIHEAGEARTLRELCEGDALDAWASDVATEADRRAMRRQLDRWLGTGARFGEDDPARLAVVEPLPRDPDAVLTWSRSYALVGELARPAREVVRDDDAALSTDTTLLECCLGLFEELAPGTSLLATHRLEDDARGYLAREAANHDAHAARSALWTRPIDGPLRRLADALRGTIAGTDFPALASVTFVPARRVSLDAAGVARGTFAGGVAGPVSALLLLSGYEQRAIEGQCDRCTRPGCLHVRALAARLLDACADVNDRLHRAVRQIAEVPSWKRFLHALSTSDVPDDGARAERLSFRLRVDADGRATVGVALEKKKPDGQWSVGRQIPVADAIRTRACTPVDRAVLDAMSAVARHRTAQPVLADLSILRSLVEHPRTELGDRGALRLREEILHVELVEQPEGLVPRIALAGVMLPPRARPREAYVLLHEPEERALVFAALTEPLRRLFAALEWFRGVLPPESWPALAPWLASLRQIARVSAPNSMRGTERDASAKLLLRLVPWGDEGLDVTIAVRALAMAPLWSPGQGPELVHGLEAGTSVFARRDLDRERAIAQRVIDALGLERHLRLEPFAYRVEAQQDALAVLSNAARCSDVLHIEWAEHASRVAVASTIRASDLTIDLRRRGAWLILGGGAQVPGADIAIGRLLDAARRGERFVPIAGGDFSEIERELFERLQRVQFGVAGTSKEPAIPLAAAPYWVDSLGDRTRDLDGSASAWLRRDRTPSLASIDPAWRTKLREYQCEGLAWLLDRAQWAPGACLADEMGLGKTIQTIGLLDARASLGAALVVAPTSVVSVWTTELERFAPHLQVHLHRGTGRRRNVPHEPNAVVVTSYDVLLRDGERFAEASFATLVADEAQAVKNARTQRARAVARVDAAFRLALSGTPIENRLADLWSLFHLIAPDLFGSWARFRARFAIPIERYEDADRAAALRALISPLVLRRTKSEVASELPPRTEVVHRVELSPAEQDLYGAAVRQARRSMRKRGPDDTARTVRILAELTRLRQLACHPRLVVEDARVESSKLHALLRLLDDVLPRGHRVLVFSQFTRHLDLVREALDARGVESVSLDGSTPAAERARRVERYQRGETAVFLISLKAGGTGLNLTAADYVVHLDPWWNPSAEDQASDRAHRIGQDRPVTVVRLVAQGTIEETVLAMHADKRRLAASILTGMATASPLDEQTLEALLAG